MFTSEFSFSLQVWWEQYLIISLVFESCQFLEIFLFSIFCCCRFSLVGLEKTLWAIRGAQSTISTWLQVSIISLPFIIHLCICQLACCIAGSFKPRTNFIPFCIFSWLLYFIGTRKKIILKFLHVRFCCLSIICPFHIIFHTFLTKLSRISYYLAMNVSSVVMCPSPPPPVRFAIDCSLSYCSLIILAKAGQF